MSLQYKLYYTYMYITYIYNIMLYNIIYNIINKVII